MLKKMTTISAVIAAKNEEDKIEKCLQHLNWVNEIIIIDNGSTDNTAKLCRKYTQKIYYHNKPALIPFLQNLGIQKASQEWVIIVDADVIVPTKAKEEILNKINSAKHDGYYLRHVTYFLGKQLSSPYFGEHNILKLFKRTKGYFKCEHPHEPITFSGKNIGHINERLLHYAHPSISTFLRKLDKYSTEDAIKRARTENYNLFQIFIIPTAAVMYYFFARKGYLDRTRGLIYCCLLGFRLFLERAKIWEIRHLRGNH